VGIFVFPSGASSIARGNTAKKTSNNWETAAAIYIAVVQRRATLLVLKFPQLWYDMFDIARHIWIDTILLCTCRPNGNRIAVLIALKDGMHTAVVFTASEMPTNGI